MRKMIAFITAMTLGLLMSVDVHAAVKRGKPAQKKPAVSAKPGKASPRVVKPAAQKPSFLFRALDDFRWGHIDKTGKVVRSGYEDTGDFSDGLAPVKLDGSYGYMDAAGKMIIAPRFDGAGGFSEGLAPVRVENLWGYVDKTGNTVIPPRYAEASKFSEGLAVVKVGAQGGEVSRGESEESRW